MPTILKRQSIPAAGGTIENILANSQYEFAPFDGVIELGILAESSDVTASIFSGPDVLMEPGSAVPFSSTLRTPNYPDDYVAEDEVAAGDRLKVSLVNSHATLARIVFVSLKITPK